MGKNRAPARFEAVERRSVTGQALDQIRALIASGALPPGQRLPPERTLAELFGVSRPSVREATRALAAMGLLEIHHGNGVFVGSLSPKSLAQPLTFFLDANSNALLDLFQVRLMLEVGAAEAAATLIDDGSLNRLGQLLKVMPSLVADLEAFLEADIAFHRVIHEASGNSILLALMDSLSALGRRSRRITGQLTESREDSLRQHRVIYGALKRHNPATAQRAMRNHLTHVRKYLHGQAGESGRPEAG